MIQLLEQLFIEIEHGDQEHRDWLRKKMEKFSRKHAEINEAGYIDAMKYGMGFMGGKHNLPKPSRKELRDCSDKMLILIEGNTMVRTRKKQSKKPKTENT